MQKKPVLIQSPKVVLNFRCPAEMVARIQKLATAQHLTPSALIRAALRKHL